MGVSKNSFVQVGGVSPKRRNRVYDTNKFYYFTTFKINLFIRYEISRFNNNFMRIAAFRRNAAIEFMIPINFITSQRLK
jgi:hypothetical protein